METANRNHNNNLAAWALAALVVIAYLTPLFILGNNCYIRLHDTLEGEWVWLKLLADKHMAFNFSANAIMPQVMKGIPRSLYPTGLSINMVLVQFAGAYYGYLISSMLIRLTGFFSMLLLLRSYFISEEENKYIVILTALAFSMLSFFIPFGLSMQGQPLLLWAFLNLQNKRKLLVSYFIIGLFPFYASIVWLAIPFAAVWLLLSAYFIYKKQLNFHFIVGGILLLLMFSAVNFPLLNTALAKSGFIQHRHAYNLYMLAPPTLAKAIGDTLLLLFTTHYHVAIFITAASFTAILLTIKRNDWLMMTVMAGIILICLFQGFYIFPEYWLGDKFELIKTFRFNRFSILLPMLWFLGFGLALSKMSQSEILKQFVWPFLLVQLFIAAVGDDEIFHNYRTLLGYQRFPGYQNYVANNQFEEIKKYIGLPVNSYYVASLGISPSVAQFNGFYTLDGLMSVYDLNYKNTFRKVFAGEIEKSRDIAQYYDGWGNRCYIFSSELGIKHAAFNCYKFAPRHIDHLSFDATAFGNMGGKYLISAVNITNHDSQGLHFEKEFKDPTSWWTIYLYSIKQPA